MKQLMLLLMLLLALSCFGVATHLFFVRDNENKVSCWRGYTVGMTGDAVSKLLDIPVMAPSKLPVDALKPPQARPGVTYPIESPVCVLEVNYPAKTGPSPLVRVRIYEETNSAFTFKEGADKWNCTGYGPDYEKIIGFKSSCGATFPQARRYWNVVILSQFPSDTTLSIALSMEFNK